MRVAIAGSTGSIGTQTLDVISSLGDGVEVVALSVGSSVDGVVAQAKQWKPKVVVVSDDAARAQVAAQLPGVSVVAEPIALVENADVVVNGVVG
ncbi:MAG: 1-deoxy-D-xylulose-5-phosphate reductoisomerase, partial [Actinobacteria bacterium]|nr:1-deoxy-D-xylulose-5-phosphate reductoisomerase [Actinomycetota bacterium]